MDNLDMVLPFTLISSVKDLSRIRLLIPGGINMNNIEITTKNDFKLCDFVVMKTHKTQIGLSFFIISNLYLLTAYLQYDSSSSSLDIMISQIFCFVLQLY